MYSEKCLEYAYEGHIENPLRVKQAMEILEGLGYEIIEPVAASEEDLLKVHTERWINQVKKGDSIDLDTPGGKTIYEQSLLSAGSAIIAANVGGFSVSRPPGHHAGRDGKALGAPSLGFCYFNNMAVATRHLNKRTLIVDIDGHHGNGTQDIFHGDPSVIYVSLHGVVDFPGTGAESVDNCINIPLRVKLGDDQYMDALGSAIDQIDMAPIEVIGISAGFDAHEGEIASLCLTSKCYKRIGEKIRSLNKFFFGVLEGGYSGIIVGESIDQLIQGLEGR